MPMKPPADHDDRRDEQPEERSAIDAAVAEEGAAETGDAETPDLETQLKTQQDRLLRLQAELENLRSRHARELAEQHRYAGLELARDLLPVVDNVDRAIEASEKGGEQGTLLEGFRMVRQQLAGVLAQHQCVPIDAAGEPFDPQFHEAILQQPSDDAPANHVSMVTQTGYRMHDRVVRPAQVIVSSGPAEE